MPVYKDSDVFNFDKTSLVEFGKLTDNLNPESSAVDSDCESDEESVSKGKLMCNRDQ